MKFLIFLPVIFFFSFTAFSQGRPYSTTNEQAIKYFAIANQDLDENLFDDAISNLQKSIEADSKFVEAYAVLGDIYRKTKQHALAVDQFLKVIDLNPYYNRSIYIKIGEDEISLAKYEAAQRHLEHYISYPNSNTPANPLALKLLKDCKFSIEAIAHPVPFKPVNMGPQINTADDEYHPVATADEATLIFTRQINHNEDLYKSDKVDNKWQTATYLSDHINTPQYNEAALSISQDGKILFFTGCNRPDGRGRCHIYNPQKKANDWSKPFDLSPPVNTRGWEAQPSISADGRTLYYVSNRKGGYGGYDIWKSTLTDKGWGDPENMGPNINTAYDEQSPFIHPDDSTFYFCSDGWPGLGGKDLFVSRLSKDGKWQKPENLGYPINSSGDENGLTLTANGTYAFFASNHLEGYGGYDIYTFEVPANLRPHIVTYVKGRVTDGKTKQPLEAAVEIVDLQKDIPVYQDYSDPLQGDFLATITSGKNYGLNISKAGYLFYSANFSLVGHEAKNPFNVNIALEPIEIGNKVILANIFFDTNKFDLKTESVAELQHLVQFLMLNPTLRVEISGHTDNVGNSQLNKILSENRAKSVYQYLINSKIDATRMVYKGYGETQPIAPNTTDDGRAKNRRTEFKITAK
jgi:outer membrane protein OmpA-like peptidoglycan-associated protein/tetratricopeptide (TPR) repeat protein